MNKREKSKIVYKKMIVLWKETANTVEQELRREVEDLKLRLQMAADHYKEKFKECQKLQKQVNKFTEQTVSRMKEISLAFHNFSTI